MLADDIRTAVAGYIHDRLARESSEWGRSAAIARATGVTPAHIANVKNGKAAAGVDLARLLAKYWEMTESELEAAAIAWFEARGRPARVANLASKQWTELLPRYPNLAEAVAILRREGEIDAAFLDEIEETKLLSENDLPVTVWWRTIENEANKRRYASRVLSSESSRTVSPAGVSIAQQMERARAEAGVTPRGGEPIDTSTSDGILEAKPATRSSSAIRGKKPRSR